MPPQAKITTPNDPELSELCARLRQDSGDVDAWPQNPLAQCAAFGVYEWFVSKSLGGQEWSSAQIMEGNRQLAASNLTTTFVLTQLTGALQRVAGSGNERMIRDILPALIAGEQLATLGISHLTTSRQHLGKPALQARRTSDGFVFDGISPWVTGAAHVDYVVTGATLEDGEQLLAVVPLDQPGVRVAEPQRLVALTGSRTGAVFFEATPVDAEWVLAGPQPNIMQQGRGARTGGLQTSTLALGLASAALQFIQTEAGNRSELIHPAEQLQAEWEQCCDELRAAAAGEPCAISNVELRTRANSLVLRATQAALSAAKGAGYVEGHPAGRWCREALFFLVWSCPQQVVDANLCEFAGIG